MTRALSLIRQFEGLRLTAYRCPAGIWTIGYGHTRGVTPAMVITAEQAEALLQADVDEILASITAHLPHSLTDSQIAAITSLAFNIGTAALLRSTLWRLLCADPANPAIRQEFMRWIWAGGKKMPGLITRRQKEADLYFS